MDTKTVVQGGHGPVPMEENTTRYIDADPVEVQMSTYYLRRMMSGELVEYTAPSQPMTMTSKPIAPATFASPLPTSEEK